MARITLTLEITDEQQAALVNRFINEARAYVDEDDGAPAAGAVPGALDARGVPWHADFHAASMTKTQAGEWKKRKGGDKAAIEAYERQFTAPQAAPAADEPVEIPAFMQRQPATPAPVAPAMPTMPAPVTFPPMPAPAAAAPVSYDEMIAVFNETGTRIGVDRVQAETLRIYGVIGITDPNALTTDETMRAKLVAQLRAIQ